MKRTLKDIDVRNKIVLLRCDFNVPMQNGQILDDSKIVESLPTIEYLIEQECRIVILSHLGKVKSEEDKQKYSLEAVARRLNGLLGIPVQFSKSCRNVGLFARVREMQPKDILLLENTRYEDFPEKLESSCDTQLSMYWAGLADVFILDAFGSAHRVHSSTAGVAKYIPSAIGLLVEKEIENLNKYVLNAEKPFTVIMGGSKVDDKLPVIEAMLPKCDYLLLGGGLANAFLKALGFNIGFNDIDLPPELSAKLKKLMLDYKEKIMLPLDVIVGSSFDAKSVNYRLVDKIESNDLVYDIGAKTLEKYKTAIKQSKTVFVNGTVGVYEDKRFANGTKELFAYLAKADANVITGGGDSVSAVNQFGFANKFTYLSSGGGATLEYITKGNLLALEFIEDKKDDNYEILDVEL